MNPPSRPTTTAALAAAVGGLALAAPTLAQIGFTPRDVFNGADGAFSVFAADIDGDGDTDVLSAAFQTDDVRWHEQQTSPAHSIPGGALLAAEGAINNAATIEVAGTVSADGAFSNTANLRLLDGAVDDPDHLIQLGGNCPTDSDGNGVVNAADVGVFLSRYFEDLVNLDRNGG